MNRQQRRAAARRPQSPARTPTDVAALVDLVEDLDVDARTRETALELVKALHDLVHSRTLALSPEQRVLGDRCAVAYLTWWLEQRGLDLHLRTARTEG